MVCLFTQTVVKEALMVLFSFDFWFEAVSLMVV